MAKKSKNIEKETRRLIESVSDCIKKKGDRYKFKTKNKKTVKKIKKSCVHWAYRKGKETPVVYKDPQRPGYWKCPICKVSFPINPLKPYEDEENPEIMHNPYEEKTTELLELVNQVQFYSVKLGGNADDTKLFLNLKRDLPNFIKAAKHIIKHVEKREKFERNRATASSMSQFDIYEGFTYNTK